MAFKLKTAAPAKKAAAKKIAPAKKVAAKKAAPRRVEEGEAPAPRKKSAAAAAPKGGVISEGWDDSFGGGGDFIKALNFPDDGAKTGGTLWFVLKFLEERPYANVKVHWLQKKGKRSYICIGEGCPLCEIGADVKAERRFNVAVFTDAEPLLRSWSAGYKIYTKIKSLSEQPLTRPLPKRIYLATRTGVKFNEITYDIGKLTPDEVEEAYPDLYIPSPEELEAIEPYTLEDVEKEFSSMDELEEVAAQVVEGEDDDG